MEFLGSRLCSSMRRACTKVAAAGYWTKCLGARVGGEEAPDLLVDVGVVRPHVAELGQLDVIDLVALAPVLLGVLARDPGAEDPVLPAMHDHHRKLALGIDAAQRLQAERAGV